jgi:hypothetical protein
MKAFLLGTIAALVVMVIVLGAAVVRLEKYRYANSLGMCDEYFSRDDPTSRVQREKCLESKETRTHWLWHIVYATKIL